MAEPQLFVSPPLGLSAVNEYGRTTDVWDQTSHPVIDYATNHINLRTGIGVVHTSAIFGYLGDLDGEAGVIGNLSRTFEVDWACSGGEQFGAIHVDIAVQVRSPFANEDDEHELMLDFYSGDLHEIYPTPEGAVQSHVRIGLGGTWAFQFDAYNGVDEYEMPQPCAFEEIPYPFGYVTFAVGISAAAAANWNYFNHLELDLVIRPTGTPLPWQPPAQTGDFWTGFVKTREVAGT